MTGFDKPRPGRSAFQRTPSVPLHLVGRFVSFEMPSPPGPRNCGTSSARREETSNTKTMYRHGDFMLIPSLPHRFAALTFGFDTTHLLHLLGYIRYRHGRAEVIAHAQLERP